MEAYIEAGVSRVCSPSTIRVYPSRVSAPTCSAVCHPLASVPSKSSTGFSRRAAIAPLTGLVSSHLANSSILRLGRAWSQSGIAKRGVVGIAAKRIETESKDSKQKRKDPKQETKKKREFLQSSVEKDSKLFLQSSVEKKDSKLKNKIIEEDKDYKSGSSSKRGVGNIKPQKVISKDSGKNVFPKKFSPRSKQLQKSTALSSIAPSDISMNLSKPKNDSNDESRIRPSKRSKKDPEEVQWNLKLNMSSKNGDLHSAIEVYGASKQGLFSLKQHHYNVLLYICSAAASGSITRRKRKINDNDKNSDGSGQQDSKADVAVNGSNKNQGLQEGSEEDMEIINFSPEDVELAKKMGTEIYEHMLEAKVPPNEATFTSIARLAVAKGDGDMAFEVVKNMTASSIAPKLRSYGPVLLCFAQQNQVQKAFEVDEHMLAAGVLPDETLLEALLSLSVTAGLDDKVYSLLHRLRSSLRDLSQSTVATIEKWFTSEAAASAGKVKCDNLPSEEKVKEAIEATGGGWHGLGWLGRGPWKTTRTNISRTGCCLSCGEKLCTIDLDPVETEKFAKSLAELAYQREHNSNQFRAFQTWLDKNGPYDAIIDGANIGMYNNALRGFNFNQVATVAQAVKEKSPTQKSPLIVIHSRRVSEKAGLSPKATQIVNEWNTNKCLYSTPYGSNDDWYWLYAAVHYKCLLVTNDEMRDHLFQLLGNDFFPKWKERHQVRFTFSSNGLELFMPPPFTTVIQESLSGNWHIPQTGGDDFESPREWLCVTRSCTVENKDAKIENETEIITSETMQKLEVAEKNINSTIPKE